MLNIRFLLAVSTGLLGNACVAATSADTSAAYIGLFGGGGAVTATTLQQKGAVLINENRSLPINAKGSTGHSSGLALGGVQVGYEWNRLQFGGSRWGLKPALELEGLYLGKHSPTGEMPVTPRALGTQYVNIPTTAGVFLANAIFTLQTPYSKNIFPYLGVGAGAARVSIKGSDSANPSEPGINHFNSDPDASDTAFAWQLKAGVKAEIAKNLYVFTEYRYLSINSTRYTFGSTDYPGVHLPTLSWDVSLGRQQYNLFVAGLQYRF